jgi:hypothetical protein
MKNLSQPLRKLATCAGLILVIAPCAFAIAQDDNEEETEAAHMSETSRSSSYPHPVPAVAQLPGAIIETRLE